MNMHIFINEIFLNRYLVKPLPGVQHRVMSHDPWVEVIIKYIRMKATVLKNIK